MSKTSDRIGLILGLFSVILMTGCGVTSTSLPSGLQPAGGGSLSIQTSTFPDAITGRTYNLILSTSGGSGVLASPTGCVVVSGALPSGLSWTNGPASSQCTLTGTVTSQAGTYSVVVQATDTSSPAKTDQLPYTITVRNDFTITQASLLTAVQGRPYGTGTGCAPTSACSQVVTTSLAATEPAIAGSGSALGNGPVSACAVPAVGASNPNISTAVAATASECVISSTAVGAAGSYTAFTVSVTDTPISISGQSTPVVPSRTITKTFTLAVDTPLQITQSLGATWPAAVNGRAYGSGSGCSGGLCASAVYTVTGGLAPYIWPAATPTSISTTGLSCTASSATYTCSTAKITAAAGPYSPSVAVSDTANQATPGGTPTTDPNSSLTGSLTVNAGLSGTQTPSTLATAVNGRDFAKSSDTCASGAACVPIIFTLSGGLPNYVWPATLSGITGFSCTATGTNLGTDTCSATALSAAATTYSSVTTTPSDTANQSTPSGTFAFSTSLTVVAALSGTSTPTTLAAAVTGRDFGVTTDSCAGPAACVPVMYTLTGGLPTYSWPSPNTLSGVTGFTCAAGGTGNSTDTCSAKALSAAAATYPNVTITGTDTANTQAPSGAFTFPVMSLTVNAALGGSQSPATLAAAVTGRDFAVGSDTCASGAKCAPLVYTATGGLPNYNWPATNTPSGITGFTCTIGGTGNSTDSCSAPSLSVAQGTYSNINITETDTANTQAPSGSFTFPNTSLTVNAAMSGTQTPGTLAAAVTGRDFGKSTDTCAGSTACVPLVYTAAGGLSNYVWPATLTGVSGFTCTASGTGNNTGTCSAASLSAAAGSYTTINITETDTANTQTPSGSYTFANTSLTVNAAMSGTQTPGTLATAVTGRDFGKTTDTCAGSAACVPLMYTVSGGLPNYGWPATNTVSGVTGFTCTASGGTNSTDTCSATALSAAAGTYSSVTITATDTANTQAPSGSYAFANTSLTVNAELAVTGPTPNPVPEAVLGRPYGMPMGSANLAFGLASGEGLPPVSLSGTGFPAPIACSTVTDNSDSSITTFACDSGNAAVSGATSTGTITASDTANASTPAATASTDPDSVVTSTSATQITVDPEIVIQNQALSAVTCGTSGTPCSLPNGQLNQPFSVLFSCQVPLNTGICGGTGPSGNATATYSWSAPTNNIGGVGSSPNDWTTGVSETNPSPNAGLSGVTFSGTPSASGSAQTVIISVADLGNSATPSCTAASTCPTEYFSTNILPSEAFVGDNGSDQVDVFDTSTGAPSFTSTVPTSGATSNYPAASPNGKVVFVADPGKPNLYIVTSTAPYPVSATSSGLSGTSGDVAAVSVGPKAVTGATNSLNTPDDVYAYVANPVSDNVQVVDGYPSSGTFATVVATISLAHSPESPGATDIKVAPTFNTGSSSSPTRVTHAYVLRRDTHEVCVIDAEPSDTTTFLTQIPADNGGATNSNADGCISLQETSLTPNFIDVSPDGLYAMVTEGNGTSLGFVEVIDTNPNDTTTFETVIDAIELLTPESVTIGTGNGSTTFSGTLPTTPIEPGSVTVTATVGGVTVTGADNGSGTISGTDIASGSTVDYATGAVSVTFTVAPDSGTPVQAASTFLTVNPQGVRFSPDGQTAWVASTDNGQLLPFSTVNVAGNQFTELAPIATPSPATDAPVGIAFRPDFANGATSGGFGLAALSGTDYLLPFTASAAGTEVAASGLTTPWQADHVPNAVLHIATVNLPTATHNQTYTSSVVAGGPYKFYTFTELTGSETTALSAIGLSLSQDGEISGTLTPSSAGTYTFAFQVMDQSQPVSNVVVQTVQLMVN